MSRKDHVKQEDYDLIWAVYNKHPEWTYVKIGEIAERDSNTVSRVLKCESLEEYHKLNKKIHEPKEEKKQKVEEKKSEEISTPLSENYQFNRLHEQLKSQNEKLAVMTEYMRDCARILSEIKKELTGEK